MQAKPGEFIREVGVGESITMVAPINAQPPGGAVQILGQPHNSWPRVGLACNQSEGDRPEERPGPKRRSHIYGMTVGRSRPING